MSLNIEELRSQLQQTREELEYIRPMVDLSLHDVRAELEQVKAERDEAQRLLKNELSHAVTMAKDNENLQREVISLRTELSAKDKVLEHFYGDESMYDFYGMGVQIMEDRGKLARSILSQYKGESHE